MDHSLHVTFSDGDTMIDEFMLFDQPVTLATGEDDLAAQLDGLAFEWTALGEYDGEVVRTGTHTCLDGRYTAEQVYDVAMAQVSHILDDDCPNCGQLDVEFLHQPVRS